MISLVASFTLGLLSNLFNDLNMQKILSNTAPSTWVTQHAPLIATGGKVLDLACGTGRHTLWLAAQGFRVDALDRNTEALAAIPTLHNIQRIAADIENGTWPDEVEQYDGIIVTRYLYRPILTKLASMLKPNGVLIYETFMVGNERFGKPTNPDFLLLENELYNVYAPLLNIIVFESLTTNEEPPAVIQRICARNSGKPLK